MTYDLVGKGETVRFMFGRFRGRIREIERTERVENVRIWVFFFFCGHPLVRELSGRVGYHG